MSKEIKKVIICIKAKEGIFTFKYSNNGAETRHSLQELSAVFGKKDQGKPCYVMTSEIREKAIKYALLNSKTLPFFHKFGVFIKSIPLGSPFIILNGEPKNTDEQMYYNFLIESSNETCDEQEIASLIQEKHNKLPDSIKEKVKNYNAQVFSQNKTSRVGEPDKNKRVCRFCSKSKSTGASFKNKAHAVSEALGNKTILINEECDSCNEKFGNSIENELLNYFDLFRTLAGLKGKKGYRKLEFDECSLFYDGKFLNMKVKEGYDDVFNAAGEEHRINLTSNHNIASVNVYKALCKFAISVIPSEEILYFKKTIKWINGDLKIKKLPSIFTSFSVGTNSDNKTPQIMIFFRKHEDLSFPFLVVELTLNSSKTIFIVPACKKDDRNFTSQKDNKLFKRTFCYENREWEEKVYDGYEITNITQSYSLDMSPMKEPPNI